MSNDTQNRFERRRSTQNVLVSEEMNPFERHAAIQASKRNATAPGVDEREAKRAAQRASWSGPGRRDVKTTSGTPATPTEAPEVENFEALQKKVRRSFAAQSLVTHVGRKR